jgi:hypothetical protein
MALLNLSIGMKMINYKQRKTFHLYLLALPREKLIDDSEKELLRNKWPHAVVEFGFGGGVHVLKEKSSMKDIRFTNPENCDVNREHAL